MLLGNSASIIIVGGALMLGTWQSVLAVDTDGAAVGDRRAGEMGSRERKLGVGVLGVAKRA